MFLNSETQRSRPITHSNVNFMRLEIEQEAEEKNERKSNIPIELNRFYKKGGWLEPLEDPHDVMGNDILNISILCVQGKDYNLPEFAIYQLTESVGQAKRYKAMLQDIHKNQWIEILRLTSQN